MQQPRNDPNRRPDERQEVERVPRLSPSHCQERHQGGQGASTAVYIKPGSDQE